MFNDFVNYVIKIYNTKDKILVDKFFGGTNLKNVMTSLIWILKNKLPMFETMQFGSLKIQSGQIRESQIYQAVLHCE